MSPVTPLLLTPGDPIGIGPEVAMRALASREPGGRPVVLIGDADALTAHAGPPLVRVDGPHPPPGGVGLWVPPDGPEPVEVRALRLATDVLLRGGAAGLVTGPIHKGRLVRRGFAFTGHTDFLGHLCGVPDPVMAFVGGRVRVALVTVHLPLRRVPDALTTSGVLHTIRAAHAALTHDLGLPTPRLLVCGLNPHAGDQRALGDEDADVIAPAVLQARTEGLDAVGPISAEAAFVRALQGDGDLIVAMYHDQGLAPLKALDFGQSVNWTLGLPFVRTSVDHGTADDLVGTGRADPASMVAALRLAEALVVARP